MNNYLGLDTLKSYGGRTTAVDDSSLLNFCEAASRAVDRWTRRRFYALVDTRALDAAPGSDSRLWLTDDLVSVTTLKVDADGDGTYEMTLVADTDYWLWPYDASPKGHPYRAIDLNPRGSQLTLWPTTPKAVQVAGVWGYSYEVEAAGTLGGAIGDLTGTSVTMAAGHSVQAGDTLKIESEQVWVSAVATNTLTVTRAMNGTTASTHANATAVSRRRYAREIEAAVGMQAQRLFQSMRTGGGAQIAGEGMGFGFGELWPAIRDFVRPYIVPVAR